MCVRILECQGCSVRMAFLASLLNHSSQAHSAGYDVQVVLNLKSLVLVSFHLGKRDTYSALRIAECLSDGLGV